MKFTKMHGLGNDYIYINNIEEQRNDYEKLSIELSKRHFSVGSDGIIVIDKSNIADYKMRIINADGSEGEMCGNGIRCIGKYLYENNMVNKETITIETLAGIKTITLHIKDNKVETVSVDMGIPHTHNNKELNIKEITHNLIINNHNYEVIDISVGNPHTVIFVDKITDDMVLTDGPLIENDKFYPSRTNVEFVEIIDDNNINMRVWERGSGETFACGTGSCASTVAYLLKQNKKGTINVHLIGGTLKVTLLDNNHIMMEGPATKVYEGYIEI